MGDQLPIIDDPTFNRLARLVYDRAGIVLRDGKQSLVSGRLRKHVEGLGYSTWSAYVDDLETNANEVEVVPLLDLLSTNVTSFFREPAHFVHLAEQMRQMATRHAKIRVWCAAAATGEEPYSLAMTLAEVLPATSDWKILATDISTRALDTARLGRYPTSGIRGLSPERLARWFTVDGDHHVVATSLRQRISYVRLNLIEPPYPMHGPLHAIFVRNVMIYFDNAGRETVLTAMAPLLAPDACLYVGHTESLVGLAIPFRTVGPAIYVR